MNIEQMIEVLEAAKRGEKIMVCNDVDEWQEWDGKQWRDHWEFRIAPKKEMTLVEELLYVYRNWPDFPVLKRAADRIEFLELATESMSLERRTTDELLAELKRRCDV